MSQDSKLPEEKQVFAVNHSVCTGNLGTVSHSYQEMVGTFLNPELPDASHRPTIHTGLSKDNRSQDHNVSPFCMDTPTPYPCLSHTQHTGPCCQEVESHGVCERVGRKQQLAALSPGRHPGVLSLAGTLELPRRGSESQESRGRLQGHRAQQ